MRDLGTDTAATAAASSLRAITVAEIELATQRLVVEPSGLDDAGRIDRLAALERLRCATEAALSETTGEFVASQRALAAERGIPEERRDRGLAAQVALARRESPTRGRRDVALAMLLRRGELPHTRAVFRAGGIDRWKTTLIARETACLSAEHRALVDERLCADPEVVEGLSVRQLIGRLHQAAAELDPAAVVARRRRAEADRHATVRPAPDTMSWFGALLPVKDGVAVYATLDREARAAKNAGDPRTLGQLRADLLVHHVVNPSLADTATGTRTRPGGTSGGSTSGGGTSGGSSRVPVMINVVVSDAVLFGDVDGVGHLEGYGPVPGDLIREWLTSNLEHQADLAENHADDDTEDPADAADAADQKAAAKAAKAEVAVWLRRVYEQPETGKLVAMDSEGRFFPHGLAGFIRIRDRRCRSRFCDGRIRASDHVERHADGGPTSEPNGQGLCEHCNLAKEATGWTARPRPGPRHTVETTTPTGHTYTSEADPL